MTARPSTSWSRLSAATVLLVLWMMTTGAAWIPRRALRAEEAPVAPPRPVADVDEPPRALDVTDEDAAPADGPAPGTRRESDLPGSDPEAIFARPSPLDGPFGPLPVIQVDSLSILFFQAPADKATTIPARTWQASADIGYAEHEVSDWNDDMRVHAHRDHELMFLEMRGKVGLTDDLELEVVLPFRYATFGVLDDFIKGFHEVTGLGPEGSRERFRDDMEIEGVVFFNGSENVFSLADVPISLKYAILPDEEGSAGLAVRGGIQLPTGREDRSFGNGKVDGGLGVLVQKTVGDFTLYFAGDAFFQSTPESFSDAGVEVEPVIGSAQAAVEWRPLDWLGVVAQIQWAQNIIANLDVTALSRDRLTTVIGVHFRVHDHVLLRLGFGEDILSGPSYDVLFHGGVTVGF